MKSGCLPFFGGSVTGMSPPVAMTGLFLVLTPSCLLRFHVVYLHSVDAGLIACSELHCNYVRAPKCNFAGSFLK